MHAKRVRSDGRESLIQRTSTAWQHNHHIRLTNQPLLAVVQVFAVESNIHAITHASSLHQFSWHHTEHLAASFLRSLRHSLHQSRAVAAIHQRLASLAQHLSQFSSLIIEFLLHLIRRCTENTYLFHISIINFLSSHLYNFAKLRNFFLMT